LTQRLVNHTLVFYGNYRNTIVPVIFERDTVGGQAVVNCEYSREYKLYTPPFDFVATGYSREHLLPRSWMPTGGNTDLPEGADYHKLSLTNLNQANSLRSNIPFGNVLTPTTTFLNCKRGTDNRSITVFEPADGFKGDAARGIFYSIICYNGNNGNWAFNDLPSLASNQDIQVLIDWHFIDLPDAFEKTKHEYIYSIQGNRNPFIDFPELVGCIDFAELLKANACDDVINSDETNPL